MYSLTLLTLYIGMYQIITLNLHDIIFQLLINKARKIKVHQPHLSDRVLFSIPLLFTAWSENQPYWHWLGPMGDAEAYSQVRLTKVESPCDSSWLSPGGGASAGEVFCFMSH